jgi:hypothetical protein
VPATSNAEYLPYHGRLGRRWQAIQADDAFVLTILP